MKGTINVYVPRRADGERMTGVVPKGQRARATFTRSVEVHPFFDSLADRNPANAIPVTDPRHPVNAKRRPLNPRVAPKGWSLRPVERVPLVPDVEVGGPTHCGKRFRTSAGFAWHITNVHRGAPA